MFVLMRSVTSSAAPPVPVPVPVPVPAVVFTQTTNEKLCSLLSPHHAQGTSTGCLWSTISVLIFLSAVSSKLKLMTGFGAAAPPINNANASGFVAVRFAEVNGDVTVDGSPLLPAVSTMSVFRCRLSVVVSCGGLFSISGVS